MQSFPQPPSAKEEKEYMRRCHQGDKEARNLLIERNLRLVAYIARKYSAKERDMDDLISIGTIGLIKAVDSFDENKGLRLASYASRCIEKTIQQFGNTAKTLFYRGSEQSSQSASGKRAVHFGTYRGHRQVYYGRQNQIPPYPTGYQ
jgi:RNA polymerase sporulation-specific sigma factor